MNEQEWLECKRKGEAMRTAREDALAKLIMESGLIDDKTIIAAQAARIVELETLSNAYKSALDGIAHTRNQDPLQLKQMAKNALGEK